MQPVDSEFLIQHLRESKAELQAVLRDVAENEWFASPGAGRWSVGQCAEHIVTVGQRILGLLGRMQEMAATEYDAAASARKDKLVLGVADRETRVKAPDALEPQSRIKNQEAALTEYGAVHDELEGIAKRAPEWLRGRFIPHPILNDMDGYQWLLAISGHTRRHVAQIAEIKQQLRTAVV